MTWEMGGGRDVRATKSEQKSGQNMLKKINQEK